MGVVFGQVDAVSAVDLAFPPRHSKVVLHDNQSTGFRSWAPLHDGNEPRGIGGFDGSALVLHSEDRASTGDNAAQFHTSSWLSRLTMPAGATRMYLRWEWAARLWRGGNFSKGFEFGLDTDDGGAPATFAPANGNRYLLMNRCCMFDEGETKYYGGKWQYTSGPVGTPALTDLTDAQGEKISPLKYPRLGVGQNYGKVLRQYTEQVLDLSAFRFSGLRHNGIGFGSLPTGGGYNPANTDFAGFVPANGVDQEFVNGCNIYTQIDNRSTQPSKQTLYIYDVLAVAF